MVAAEGPDRGRMFYLVDDNLDFIPEVKEFLDWKSATRCAPSTIQAYCSRLLWYYRFLYQRELGVLEATPVDLTEFVIWLCNPYRETSNITPIHDSEPHSGDERQPHTPRRRNTLPLSSAARGAGGVSDHLCGCP